MTREPTTLVRHVRQLMRSAEPSIRTDRQLLESFVARHDESAFTVLVQRHGPMVLGACRRILHNGHDAEDAFQATFLVLARKASVVHWQESIGGWLYESASRVARKAKGERARRQIDERQLDMTQSPDSLSLAAGRELQTALDEEVQRLPAKYRLPIVLCCLEGVSRSAAAQQLGWHEGTVAGRLARARDLLQRRLAHRGIALAATALPMLLTEQLGSAAVPIRLSAATVRAATLWSLGQGATVSLVTPHAWALAERMLRPTAQARWTLAAALLLIVGMVTTGVAVLAAPDDQPTIGAGVEPAPEAPEAEEILVAVADPPVVVEPLRVEAAITGGLKWLARHQALDGQWSLDEFHKDGRCNCTGPARHKNDTVATGLSLLAFLGAGATHKSTNKQHGMYSKSIERGLRSLITRQNADGCFEGNTHGHGLATLALCRTYRLTNDPYLKGPSQRAVNHLVGSIEKGAGQDPLRWPGKLSAQSWLRMAHKESAGTLNVPRAALQPEVDRDLFAPLCAALVRECVRRDRQPARGARMVNELLDAQDTGGTADLRDQKGSWSAVQDTQDLVAGRLTATALALLTLASGPAAWKVDAQPVDGKPVTQQELAAAWDDLRSPDFLEAGTGMLTLVAAAPQAVTFLSDRLRPAPPSRVKPDQIAQWIAQLDAREFAVRQQATRELAELGEEAEPALQRALAGKPALEVRQRLEQLLEKLTESRRAVSRELRAVEVLARIGTPEARQVLDKLARGNPHSRLTREAKAALEPAAK